MSPIELRLREWRERRGLTQAELADAADVRVATISDLERKAASGHLRRLDVTVLEALCRELRVTPGELLTWRV